jgi:hypothetical protein
MTIQSRFTLPTSLNEVDRPLIEVAELEGLSGVGNLTCRRLGGSAPFVAKVSHFEPRAVKAAEFHISLAALPGARFAEAAQTLKSRAVLRGCQPGGM